MKRLYTSNYARQGNNPMSYAISVKAPDWYGGKSIPLLAPSWDIVKGVRSGLITHEDYTLAYLDMLEERNKSGKIKNIICNLPEDSILLCYEPPREFCHRHILGRWIRSQLPISVDEWMNEKEIEDDLRQMNLDSLLDF